jgi:hypothetical protein
MTDARFPDNWMHDARVQGLSGDHFRAFMHTLAWSAHNRTDGFVRTENLPLIHRVKRDAMSAFVNAGLCAELDGGWLFIDYLATQTTRAEFEALDKARAKARQRKADQRAKESASKGYVPRDVPRHVQGDYTGRQAGLFATRPTT